MPANVTHGMSTSASGNLFLTSLMRECESVITTRGTSEPDDSGGFGESSDSRFSKLL